MKVRKKANKDIRDMIKKSGVYYYEVADELSVSPQTFTTWLRKPLSNAKYTDVVNAIRRAEKRVA